MERVVGCGAALLREQTLKGIVKESAICIRAAARGDRIHQAIYKHEIEGMSKSDQICAQRIMLREAEMVHVHSFEGAQVIREVRYWYFEDEKKIFSAKPDAFHFIGNRGMIVNYKTGYVTPHLLPENWQIICECAIMAWTYQLDEVVGCLIHPNCSKELGYDHHYYTYSGDRLREHYIPMMVEACKRAESPFQLGTPSLDVCEYCLARKGNRCSENDAFEKTARRPRKYAARS